MKIQHALRAFTANDRKDIKMAAQNYPITEFYDVENLLTELGIGEALVTVLSEKGSPTPLVHTMLRAPQSRMDVLNADELESITSVSEMVKKYNEAVDRESAYEILTQKIEEASATTQAAEAEAEEEKADAEPGMFERMINNPVAKQVGRAVAREVTRGILGVLGLGGRSKKGGWF
jgi:HD superfamily phosphohydrolase